MLAFIESRVSFEALRTPGMSLTLTSSKKPMTAIDRTRLKSLMEREQKRFVDERPKSKAVYERGKKSLLSGVPMNWMVKWAGAFPPVVREAQGAHFHDVDGHRYVDFCLATPAP